MPKVNNCTNGKNSPNVVTLLAGQDCQTMFSFHDNLGQISYLGFCGTKSPRVPFLIILHSTMVFFIRKFWPKLFLQIHPRWQYHPDKCIEAENTGKSWTVHVDGDKTGDYYKKSCRSNTFNPSEEFRGHF
jgi:hypothetical protein